MGVRDRVASWWTGRAAAKASDYRLTSWGGDISQVINLPSSIAEAFGISITTERTTRREAMTIPTVKRGRAAICGPISSAALVARRDRATDPGPVNLSRTLLEQASPDWTQAFQLAWTVDALLFYGVAWWRITEWGSDKFPARAPWVPNYRVTVPPGASQVHIDGIPVPDREIIRFDGPDEGLLATSSRALKTYILLEEAVRKFARLDVPLGWFEDQDSGKDQTEIQTLLNAWETARATRTTGYMPPGLKYNLPQWSAGQLQLSEARNFQALEIARAMNLQAAVVNAPTGDSLTYATTESNRREHADITLAPYITPIVQRLSMPDVTPRGQTVELDLSRFLRGDLKSILDAGAVGVEHQILDPDEVRSWIQLPARAQEAPNAQP